MQLKPEDDVQYKCGLIGHQRLTADPEAKPDHFYTCVIALPPLGCVCKLDVFFKDLAFLSERANIFGAVFSSSSGRVFCQFILAAMVSARSCTCRRCSLHQQSPRPPEIDPPMPSFMKSFFPPRHRIQKETIPNCTLELEPFVLHLHPA